MKRIAIITLSLILTACATAADAAWSGPVPKPTLNGVVVEATGAVTAASGKGVSLPTAIGTELKSGSTVTVGAGGKASVMLMDGAIINIDENSSYVVGTPPPKKDKATLLRGITVALNEAANISLPAATAGSAALPHAQESKPRVHGMVKMGQLGPDAPQPKNLPFGKRSKASPKAAAPAPQRSEAVYPVETSIVLPEAISFRWTTPVAFRDPMLVVESGDSSRSPMDIAKPKATDLTVASKAFKLQKGGSYSWYLASKADKPGRGRTRRFPFQVLSAEKQAQLERDLERIDETAETPDGRDFLKGQLYFNYGMNYEMVQTLLPLWQKNKSPAIKKLLKLGYARMGQIDEARKYK